MTEDRRVTIIRPDNIVVINRVLHKVDCSSIDAAISAIQWNGERQRGHIEYVQDADAPFIGNRGITDIDAYAGIIAAWDTIENTPPPPPPPPPTAAELDAMDTAALNNALTQPGTVTRALGEILFGVIKGTIPVTPSLTKAQFVAMLKAKMRNGA